MYQITRIRNFAATRRIYYLPVSDDTIQPAIPMNSLVPEFRPKGIAIQNA